VCEGEAEEKFVRSIIVFCRFISFDDWHIDFELFLFGVGWLQGHLNVFDFFLFLVVVVYGVWVLFIIFSVYADDMFLVEEGGCMGKDAFGVLLGGEMD
jgi:hypothetical protein